MSEPARSSLSEDEERGSEEIHGPRQLSPGVSQFVESVGMLLERFGLPRIGGRIFGLLMLDEEPLSLDDISRLLGVSRASVSTNLRMSEMTGVAKRVSRPGDRRDYYVGVEDMWMQGIKTSKQDSIVQMAQAARAALPNVPAHETAARERLQEVVDFAEFFAERMDQLMEDWEAYKTKMYSQRNGNNNRDNS
jgi:DNA-binding transcriptional regulator GbsR (MarR family)